jgi:predicted nucleic acid-binding protein
LTLADVVIAAHALEGGHALFTRDEHFRHVPGLRLHAAGGI